MIVKGLVLGSACRRATRSTVSLLTGSIRRVVTFATGPAAERQAGMMNYAI
jgi:hypothetical protein